jgi:putative transcription antitermination factor YqgF
LVVGLPLDPAGGASEQVRRVEAFARRLRAIGGVRVVFWSERYSTVTAAGWLSTDGASAAPRSPHAREAARRRLDAAAAAVILQDYLDEQRQTRAPDEPGAD